MTLLPSSFYGERSMESVGLYHFRSQSTSRFCCLRGCSLCVSLCSVGGKEVVKTAHLCVSYLDAQTSRLYLLSGKGIPILISPEVEECNETFSLNNFILICNENT